MTKNTLILLCICFTMQIAAKDKTKSFKKNPKLAKLADNTVLALDAFQPVLPVGEERQGMLSDYSGMTYDMHNHRILLFGGGHATTWSDSLYSFDFKTLKWKALYEPTPFKYFTKKNLQCNFLKSGKKGLYPRPVGRHTYDLLIVPENRKEFLMLRTGTGPSNATGHLGYIDGTGGVYDFKTKKWTVIKHKDIGFGDYGDVAEYDPISQKVFGIRNNNVYAFDPETRTTELILSDVFHAIDDNGYSGCMVYYPPDKKMYIFTMESKDVTVLDLDRQNLKNSKVSVLKGTGGKFTKEETSFVYDSKNKVIGGGIDKNKFYVFDPRTKKWQSKSIKGGKPESLIFHCIIYDKINNVYIFIGKDPKDKWGQRTWAYKWKK